MTTPVDTEPVRAGYGKLPGSREYIRLDSDRGAARWFRDFLDRAAMHFAIAPRLTGPGFRFVARVPDGDERTAPLVVASVWPSADEGGRRSFPFSFYTLVPPSSRPVGHAGLFTAVAALNDDHEMLIGEASALIETTGFDRRFGSSQRPAPVPLGIDEARTLQGERARSVPLAAWFDAVFDSDGGDPVASGAMVLWRVRNVLTAARGSLARLGADCPGVRFPLAREYDACVQADTWLGLLAGPDGCLTCDTNMALGSMPHDGDLGLAVFFRPLSPRDAALFDGRGIRGMVDLATHREPADLDGFAGFEAHVRRIVSSPGADLTRLPHLLDGLTSP